MKTCAAAPFIVTAALALVAATGAAPPGGTIVGSVTTRVTPPGPIHVTIDPTVCGDSVTDESLVTDGRGGVRGAVVTVAGAKAAMPDAALVTNERCRFEPHVSVVRPKGAVKMLSKDPVMHTMHAAAADGKALFNLSLPIPNAMLSRPLDKPGVVTLSCSTHTWMRGYLVVTDDLSGVTAADGSFRLEHVPAGPHQVRVWHETLNAATMTVTVVDGQTTAVNVVLSR